MLVKEIMNKNLRPIMPETSIAEAMSLMRFYQIDCLPVVSNRKIVGLVHLRDVLAMFIPYSGHGQIDPYMDIARLQCKHAAVIRADVKRVMSKTIRTVAPDITVDDAMSIMLEEQAGSLMVTEGNRLAGLICFDDVNKAIPGLSSSRAAA